MAFWLVKSDPDEYGFADLERDRRTTWDGVGNRLALQHLRRVRRGDQVLIYHTGAEKAVVGLGIAVSDGYADPVEAGGSLEACGKCGKCGKSAKGIDDVTNVENDLNELQRHIYRNPEILRDIMERWNIRTPEKGPNQ